MRRALPQRFATRTGAAFFGMGGPRMAEAGVELVADYHEVAVVGIAEVLHKIPAVIGVQNRLAREAAKRGATLAILVDSPGTHLGVARRLKGRKIPVGYFIGPQVWAWRPGRVRVVKRLVQHMVVIFPFEEKIYRDAGVPVDFVGHPLVDMVQRDDVAARIRGAARARCRPADRDDSSGQPRERDRAELRPILAACERLAQPGGVQFVHAAAHGLSAEFCARFARHGYEIKRVEGATYDALAAADCAIVASGTATVEAALLGTPMVVVYRVAPLTASIMRHMIRTPFIGMVNLIAGARCGAGVNPGRISRRRRWRREVRRLLESPRRATK